MRKNCIKEHPIVNKNKRKVYSKLVERKMFLLFFKSAWFYYFIHKTPDIIKCTNLQIRHPQKTC